MKKSFLAKTKDKIRFIKKNPYILLLWNYVRKLKWKKHSEKVNDFDAINQYYIKLTGNLPNLKDPKTFSEKLLWLKLYYHEPLMRKCADKIDVREYVTDCGYGEILNKLINVYENVDDINIDVLPKSFVLKAAHGSAWNIICKDKEKINWPIWKRIMKSWMKQNLYWYGREWVYKDLKPRIFCEEYLEDESGGLIDYKFFCCNGIPKCVQVETGRYSGENNRNFYDMSWNLLPFGKDIPHNPNVIIPEPKNFSRMIEIAKSLSKPFCFVRVDLYNIAGKVYFGELTFFPAGGAPDFIPQEYDNIVGSWIELPNIKR